MDGVLLIDKPAGMTSHDVVAAVRRALGRDQDRPRRARSTRSPPGLLLVLRRPGHEIPAARSWRCPSATRRSPSWARSRAPATPRGRSPAPGGCRRCPPALPVGEVRQRPPRHSAVKVGGQRAYRRARRGEEFELPERIVTVHGFRELLARGRATPREPPRAAYEIECSSGTYVRSLIADLGDALLPGAAAHGDRGLRASRTPAPAAAGLELGGPAR